MTKPMRQLKREEKRRNNGNSRAFLVLCLLSLFSAGLIPESQALADSIRYQCSVLQSGTGFPNPELREKKSEISISSPLFGLFGSPRVELYLSGKGGGTPPVSVPLDSLYDSARHPGFKEFLSSDGQSLTGRESTIYSFENGLLKGEVSGKAHVTQAVSSEDGLSTMDYDLDCSRVTEPADPVS